MGRQERGELFFTAESRPKVGTILVNEDQGPVEKYINELINLEVDGIVETRTEFDCLVEELKNGIGEKKSK
jgi:hypothetical protein